MKTSSEGENTLSCVSDGRTAAVSLVSMFCNAYIPRSADQKGQRLSIAKMHQQSLHFIVFPQSTKIVN